ncbi:MAG: phosphatase PAP2 family protein [Acidobacteriota bacterium]
MTNLLAIAYLISHSLLALIGRNRIRNAPYILTINTLLIIFFLIVWSMGPRSVRLWAPVLFFWWAYLWSRQTLYAIHPAGFTLDSALIRFEAKYFGQPSLDWARQGGKALTELLNFLYFTYYLYTPVLGIYLYLRQRFGDFEKMTFAILLGYAIAYTMFSLIPVWGPRWALVDRGLLHPQEQVPRGYLFTGLINWIMYGGVALKGGAMPSAHSSTAMVFLVWCWWIWGAYGGIPASIVVTGMWLGSIYGRYHYLLDLLVGAFIGIISLGVASALLG